MLFSDKPDKRLPAELGLAIDECDMVRAFEGEVLDALANGVHGLIGIGGGIDGHVLRVFHFFAYCSSGVLSSEIYFRIY